MKGYADDYYTKIVGNIKQNFVTFFRGCFKSAGGDGVIVAAGLYHDNLVNQRVQVNGNIVKVIGEDGPIGATCAYCYRIVGTNMADYWIENY